MDIKNKLVKKVLDKRGEYRLESIEGVELELLLFFLEKVSIEIEGFIINQGLGGLVSKSVSPKVSNLVSINSLIQPYGCGTPDHASYSIIPDRPFWSACREHDICYGTYINKTTCDNEFFRDMQIIARNVASDVSGDFPVAYEIVLGSLMTLAYTYYGFVDSNFAGIALNAYCKDKGNSCTYVNGDFNVVKNDSVAIAGSGDGGSGSIFPQALYRDTEICLMPVRYYTCAYGRCVGNITTVPCP